VQISIGLSPANPSTPIGAFSPASIGGLQLWLDAADASTLFQNSNGTTAASADGDSVGYWGDKSGSSNHIIQADGTKKPLLKTNILNGKNVIRNDGVNDFLKSTTGGADSSFTVFVTNIKRGSQGSNMMAVSMGEETTGRRRCIWHPANGNTWPNTVSFNGFSRDVQADLAWVTGTANIAQFINTSGAIQVAKNNSAWTTSVSPGLVSYTATNIFLGSNNQMTEIFNGDYAEVLIYAASLSDANRSLILDYLNTKWSIY
jgi:uncharacterized protein (DUF2147 family)